jgi:predicted O-linked N-acetylglucosamine transferase (SPINDLY family)
MDDEMLKLPIRPETATELFSKSISDAQTQNLPITEMFGRAEALKALGQGQLAVELYKTWIAYNSDNELLYAAYFNYGVALNGIPDLAGAVNALSECARLKPDFYSAYINLGRALEDTGQTGVAVTQWMRLVENLSNVNADSVKHKIIALQQIGRVLEGFDRDGPAEDALKQSIEIRPGQTEAIQHWIALRQRQCKWPVISEWNDVAAKELLNGISPLSLANYTDDPMFQLARAYHYNRTSIGRPRGGPLKSRSFRAKRREGRLRIGYVSSDLREHAVGFALTDVFEQHDREKFEIFAYYCGIARTDQTQARIKAAVESWIDLNALDDEQAALKIAGDEIDILIDLNGYTKDARTKVFSRRPAPIIVNWFGFPGTMGSPYHNYLIADPYIIPPDHEKFYSEKILRLPCYQPNDRKRFVTPERPSRRDAGLPDNAFVYCCLNGMQKLTSRTFERWMTILGQTPRSVLWLLTGTQETNERLRQHAAARGVSPERIVFADKMPNPQHLARYPLADLFLDNLPYGAHTTAADALWMGVPILTLPGRSFASRVCASVVAAAGLSDLICSTPDEYVARAVSFGQNPKTLCPYKEKLIRDRDSCLLFNTPLLVNNLEELYLHMQDQFEKGSLPVPDLANLEIYHEIGLDLDLENIELLKDEAYDALYALKLEDWDASYPIRQDARLWRR